MSAVSHVFFMISKFILQSVVIHLAEWSVRLQWLGERHLWIALFVLQPHVTNKDDLCTLNVNILYTVHNRCLL
jgi:hypothetical protein